jgi:hypothetical protein
MAVPNLATRKALVASLLTAADSTAIDTLLATVSVPTDTTNSRVVILDLVAYAADRRREENRGNGEIINKTVV